MPYKLASEMLIRGKLTGISITGEMLAPKPSSEEKSSMVFRILKCSFQIIHARYFRHCSLVILTRSFDYCLVFPGVLRPTSMSDMQKYASTGCAARATRSMVHDHISYADTCVSFIAGHLCFVVRTQCVWHKVRALMSCTNLIYKVFVRKKKSWPCEDLI